MALLVMGPHAKNLDHVFFLENLVDEAMLDVDSAGYGAFEVPDRRHRFAAADFKCNKCAIARIVNVWYKIGDMRDKVVTRGKPFQSKLALYEAGVFRQD